jgi:hypothetical protein
VAEPVDQWWARRQFSRGTEVPYPVGTYREAWASFPALIRQYHPELNRGLTLTQIPPAAEVLLQWQCEAGHIFVATPTEQRERPGRRRRRSAWCPECTRLALSRPVPSISVVRDVRPAGQVAASRPVRAQRPPRQLCDKTPQLPAGTPFFSLCAPKPSSAVEAELRAGLATRLTFTTGVNAIRITRPFFDHLEVWPDILIPELQVAIEYDSTGRHGLEHVGKRQQADERKDRAVRSTGWEVIRIRNGRLAALGPHDILASGITKKTYDRIIDELRTIRGELFVDAYLR